MHLSGVYKCLLTWMLTREKMPFYLYLQVKFFQNSSDPFICRERNNWERERERGNKQESGVRGYVLLLVCKEETTLVQMEWEGCAWEANSHTSSFN
jgi:hypothetical protein